MKTIKKGTDTLECLQAAKKAGWNWDDFHKKAQKDYESVLRKALKEQGDECAYTGVWIGDKTHYTVHIDHFKKKSIYPKETFNWNNLFAAVKNSGYGADYKDEKIHGPQVEADRQYQEFWSPLQPALSDAFWYRQDGTMVPYERNLSLQDREKAQRTIDMYKLNANELKNKRAGIIRQIRGLTQLTDEDIRSCMQEAGFSFLVDFELRQRENIGEVFH